MMPQASRQLLWVYAQSEWMVKLANTEKQDVGACVVVVGGVAVVGTSVVVAGAASCTILDSEGLHNMT